MNHFKASNLTIHLTAHLTTWLSVVLASSLLILSSNALANDITEITTTTQEATTMATIKTNFGDIEIELNADKAPLSVANFIKYAEAGHYDGTIFHRVIKNFMIQGGGFAVGMQQKAISAPIPNEANNGLDNDKYTLAMARTNEPHSATSQFFINTKDNNFLNFSSETSRGWGYAVFAKVTAGEDVVDKIEKVATGRSGHHSDVPIEDVIIESVVIQQP